MRTILKWTSFVGILGILIIASCSDEPLNAELSPAAKQYLSMRLGSINALAESMNGPINQSFRGLFNLTNIPNGKLSGDSTSNPSEPGDTTIIEDPWQSCAIITEIDNEDGSHTTIQDYGEGCEEGWGDYKYHMYGKVTNTYRNNYLQLGTKFKDSYFYSVVYDHFGGSYNWGGNWETDGGGTYEGESEYDSVNQTFSGSYSYEDEYTYTFDSSTYFYSGIGTTHYDETKYVIESSEYEYATGENYFYKSKVLKPLVSNYSCYSSLWAQESFAMYITFVSGRERIQYRDGDIEGTFEIDYGDGECDNIITIYENGSKTVVDLSKSWYN
jgi:hypothetical protein